MCLVNLPISQARLEHMATRCIWLVLLEDKDHRLPTVGRRDRNATPEVPVMSSSHPESDHLRLQEASCGDPQVFSGLQFSEIAAHQISDASHTMLLSQSICISIVSKMYEQYSYGITRNIRIGHAEQVAIHNRNSEAPQPHDHWRRPLCHPWIEDQGVCGRGRCSPGTPRLEHCGTPQGRWQRPSGFPQPEYRGAPLGRWRRGFPGVERLWNAATTLARTARLT